MAKKRKTDAKITTGMKIVEHYRNTVVATQEQADARHALIAKRIDSALQQAAAQERKRCRKAVDSEAVAAITEKRFLNPNKIIEAIEGSTK